MKKIENSAAILYHYPCPDGVFSALAAHLYFKATSLFSPLFFPNTVYNPLRLHSFIVHHSYHHHLFFLIISNLNKLFLIIYPFQNWRPSIEWNYWSLSSWFCWPTWICSGNLNQSSKVLSFSLSLFLHAAFFSFVSILGLTFFRF